MSAKAQPRTGRRDVVGRRLACASSPAPACRRNRGRPTPATAPGAAAARCRDRSPARCAVPSAGAQRRRSPAGDEICAGHLGAGRGGSSRNASPSAPVSVSVSGLNDSRPAAANAVTSSGLAMKFIVVGWPSLRRGKLRLYDVTMVFGAAGCRRSRVAIGRCTARTHSPAPSHRCRRATASAHRARSSRALCSDPGVTSSGTAASKPVPPYLRGDIGRAAHVLIRRVGATADQRGRDRVDEAVCRIGNLRREPGDRTRAIRRMRPDDMRLQPREIEFDDAVVVTSRGAPRPPHRAPAAPIALDDRHQIAATGRTQIPHPSVRRPETSTSSRQVRRPCW